MKLQRSTLLPVFALASLSASSIAQVPSEIAPQLAAIGRKVDTVATERLYAPLQPKPAATGLRIERDVRYGADAEQALDVFAPTGGKAGRRPVLVMVHGGGFVAGDKTIDEGGRHSPFYDNIMLWAVKNGMVGVNINYHLAPKSQYPVAQQDIGLAVGWVQKNIASYGGDPARINLMGHSAGASHVASYVAHPEYGPGGTPGVTRVVLSSGSYEFAPQGGRPSPYFGDKGAERGSIAGLVATKIPFMVIIEERDPTPFHVQAGKLMEAVCGTGSCPPFLLVREHGHMSGVYSINTADRSLSDPILQFVDGEVAGTAAKPR